MAQRTIILSAGGTGGHLFPAFALARELIDRQFKVDLMTDPRAELFSENFPGRDIYQIQSSTLKGRSPIAWVKLAVSLQKGFFQSKKLLSEIKPDLVVGFGGYPTLPPLFAARFCQIPTLIHEANAVMGRANRLLAPFVTKIATSFTETKFLKGKLIEKQSVTGNPVREHVRRWHGGVYNGPLSGHPISLVIFGGSQGARYFSETIPAALQLLPPEMQSRITVTQQCREEDLSKVQEIYQKAGIRAKLATFFTDLAGYMATAHLVIARAGASTVSELTVMGRPSILVPLPHALDNDQYYNAKQLAEHGGAWCFKQSSLSPARLAEVLQGLFAAPEQLSTAASIAAGFGNPDAVTNLAKLVNEIVNSSRTSA